MFKILTLNQISAKGLDQFSREKYKIDSELQHPDAVLLRSYKLSTEDIVPSLKAIGRAGAGVNNIPVDHCTELGIPVFNTPGANANAVKEISVVALLLASRGILDGANYVQGLRHITDKNEMNQLVEKEKSKFGGQELLGKTLGVVGLGAIGSMVAEVGLKLGMKVLGYDPAISVDAAWRLSSEIKKMENLPSLLAKSDYISLHLPIMESTRNLINKESIRSFQTGACLINFSRGEVVDNAAVLAAIDEGKLARYVSDFPAPELLGRKEVIMLPHLGASTTEAEDNCAIMAANELIDFLENGNIHNSVNFPELILERTTGNRIALSNKNIPKMLGKVLGILADKNINVCDMLNKSRGEIAYNLLDIDLPPTPELISILENIEGVIKVRSL
ncbi:phosphoglycerate dehydrogenase [Deltaproteobacteria bacterium TL4]